MFIWFKKNKTNLVEPDIQFGRYTDSHKTDQQVEHWEKALKTFEEKKYLQSYDYFFQYLSDIDEENVEYINEGDFISFTIRQGSKIITGTVDNQHCEASTVVATFKDANVVFMRKLLEFNYQLKYSCYSFANDKIKLSFHTDIIDGSPEKLYHALREVATHSDRQDDVMINEFEELSQIENKTVSQLSEEEKEIKHRYIHIWINQAFNLIKKLEHNQHDQLIAQILVCTALKIDYFTVPQSILMNKIEQIQQIHFLSHSKSQTEKNASIIDILTEIQAIEKDDLFIEWYNTKATFGVTQPTSHANLVSFLNNEAPKSTYVKNKQQYQIHLFVQEYVIQHILFYWGIEPPSRKLLHLCLQIVNYTFFTELGFKPSLFEPINEELNKTAIQQKLNKLQTEALKRYPNFKIDNSHINYDSIPLFIESIFEVIKGLKYEK